MDTRELREAAAKIFDAAVRAVDPAEAVHRHVKRDRTALRIGAEVLNLAAIRRVVVVGLGCLVFALWPAIRVVRMRPVDGLRDGG